MVILDIKDNRPAGVGVGIIVGASQQSLNAAQTNGTWHWNSNFGEAGSFTASGTSLVGRTTSGRPYTNSITFNSPWVGFATTPAGGHGLLAGSGVYVYEEAALGYIEVGIKIR